MHVILKNHNTFTLHELEGFRRKAGTLSVDPEQYYYSYLFDALTALQFYLSGKKVQDLRDAGTWWYIPWYKAWYIEYMFNNCWLILNFVKENRNLYNVLKEHIEEGNFIKGFKEANLIQQRKRAYERNATYIAFIYMYNSSLIRLSEADCGYMVGYILLKAYIYRLKTGKYPASFTEIINTKEISNLYIKNKGKEIEFRGYRIGLIEKREDGSLYSTDASRKEHFSLYGIPVIYGISGQRTFIINEQGIMYSMDFGLAEPVKQWIKDPFEEGWEYVY